jgi:ParB family chromosome partitioning protein
MDVQQISIDLIDEPKQAIRTIVVQEKLDQLVDSIKRLGILQPLKLKKAGERYEIIFGNRRYLAAKSAGLTSVPAIVADGQHSADPAEMVHENIVREDLNPVDLGQWLKQIKETEGLTYEELGAQFGYSRNWAEQYVALTRCDAEIQAAVEAGHIDMISGRRLQTIKDRSQRMELLSFAVRSGASQNTIAGWVAKAQIEQGSRPAPAPPKGGYVPDERSPELTFTCEWCNNTKRGDEIINVRLCGECHTGFIAAVKYERERSENGDRRHPDTGSHHPGKDTVGSEAGRAAETEPDA